MISVISAFRDLAKNEGSLIPREVGIRDASTFMGFCNKHDTAMFRAVEAGPIALTQETCFLLSFRTVAYELFQKRAALRQIEIQRDLDKGSLFEHQCEIQQHLHFYREGIVRALTDLERWKTAYDTAFSENGFEAFSFFGVAFSDILPVVGCGGFYPEFDFDGRALQKFGRGGATLQSVTYNLTVVNGRSVAVLGRMEGKDGPAADFTQSFATLSPRDKAEAAIRLGFEHLENFYMNPSWWYSLPDPARNAAIARMPSGGTVVARRSICLKQDGVSYAPGIDARESLSN